MLVLAAEASLWRHRCLCIPRLLGIAAGILLIVACAPTPIFPSEIMEKADRSITFKDVIAQPTKYEGRVVEFGGEILGSMMYGEDVELLVRELPVRTTPYGPFGPGGQRGMFVIRYKGKVGAQDIQPDSCDWDDDRNVDH